MVDYSATTPRGYLCELRNPSNIWKMLIKQLVPWITRQRWAYELTEAVAQIHSRVCMVGILSDNESCVFVDHLKFLYLQK